MRAVLARSARSGLWCSRAHVLARSPAPLDNRHQASQRASVTAARTATAAPRSCHRSADLARTRARNLCRSACPLVQFLRLDKSAIVRAEARLETELAV